ncbi:MAG: hypothetical protein P8Y53_11305 [Pseudolabrys sp.]
MDNRILRGIIAGLGATFLLSICMLIKSVAAIVPQANAVQALTKVSTLWLGSPLAPWVGWAEHFFIGTLLWGVAFALVEPLLPGRTWMKGVVFSVGPWILMMVLLMPPAGAGFFGVYLGYGAALATLILHFIYGFTLGAAYGLLTPRAHAPHERRHAADLAPTT